MVLSLRKFASIAAFMILFFILVLFCEWIIINAVLGCVSMDTSIWQQDGHCFTVQQLIGV